MLDDVGQRQSAPRERSTRGGAAARPAGGREADPFDGAGLPPAAHRPIEATRQAADCTRSYRLGRTSSAKWDVLSANAVRILKPLCEASGLFERGFVDLWMFAHFSVVSILIDPVYSRMIEKGHIKKFGIAFLIQIELGVHKIEENQTCLIPDKIRRIPVIPSLLIIVYSLLVQ